ILLAILVPGSARNPHVLKYAPVSPHWPCPDWLRQLRLIDWLFIFQNAHTKKASTGRLSGAVFRFSSHALASWIQVLK
ncbi:hypothetical protein, partial [Legionella pneumophila]|uniref:hypothetical protein n=1 Tax=Legionella pneumophila TaxID=446 RepID=UPI001B7D8D8C